MIYAAERAKQIEEKDLLNKQEDKPARWADRLVQISLSTNSENADGETERRDDIMKGMLDNLRIWLQDFKSGAPSERLNSASENNNLRVRNNPLFAHVFIPFEIGLNKGIFDGEPGLKDEIHMFWSSRVNNPKFAVPKKPDGEMNEEKALVLKTVIWLEDKLGLAKKQEIGD